MIKSKKDREGRARATSLPTRAPLCFKTPPSERVHNRKEKERVKATLLGLHHITMANSRRCTFPVGVVVPFTAGGALSAHPRKPFKQASPKAWHLPDKGGE